MKQKADSWFTVKLMHYLYCWKQSIDHQILLATKQVQMQNSSMRIIKYIILQ